MPGQLARTDLRGRGRGNASTERQAGRGTIGSQLQVLREHVSASGDELAGEYAGDGQSGARLDRPGLDALRDAAEAGAFELVWCLSPACASRRRAVPGAS